MIVDYDIGGTFDLSYGNKKTIIFLIIFLILCISIQAKSLNLNHEAIDLKRDFSLNVNQNDWWPMFQHDVSNSGYSTTTGPETNEVFWSFFTNGTVHNPVVHNNRVYFGTDRAEASPWTKASIYCLDLAGNQIWVFEAEGNLDSTPAIYQNRIFCCDNEGTIYCLNIENGTLIWKNTISSQALSSPIAINGKIFFCSMDGNVYCLNANSGQKIWDKEVGYSFESTPAIEGDYLFIGNYCLSKDNGNVIWRSEIGLPLLSSPVFYNDKVYCGSIDEFLYCHDANTGALEWNYYTGSMKWKASEAAAYGNIYVGSAFGYIYCVDAETGDEIWSEKNSGRAVFSPVVCDDKLYIGSSDGTLYCHNAYTGQLLWNYTTGNSFSNALALADNKLFAGSGNVLLCFGLEQNNNSDLHCDGVLSWSNLTSGSTVQGVFFVSNIGENTSELDWAINTVPEWGEWVINPYEGEDLTPEQGSIPISLSLKVPEKKESSFNGVITVINKENNDDFEEIPVTLTTMKQKQNVFPFIKLFLKYVHFYQIFSFDL